MNCPSISLAYDNNKIHSAYAIKLKNLNKKLDNFYSYEIYNSKKMAGYNYFTYYDINNDGIDECIICHTFNKKTSIISNGGTDVIIYTYCKGKIKKLVYSTTGGGTWGGIFFYKNCKYIIFYDRAGSSYNKSTYKKIKNGKLTDVAECTFSIDMDTGEMIYTINGKAADEKNYNNFRKKCLEKRDLKCTGLQKVI